MKWPRTDLWLKIHLWIGHYGLILLISCSARSPRPTTKTPKYEFLASLRNISIFCYSNSLPKRKASNYQSLDECSAAISLMPSSGATLVRSLRMLQTKNDYSSRFHQLSDSTRLTCWDIERTCCPFPCRWKINHGNRLANVFAFFCFVLSTRKVREGFSRRW